jgi:hypothetical protein
VSLCLHQFSLLCGLMSFIIRSLLINVGVHAFQSVSLGDVVVYCHKNVIGALFFKSGWACAMIHSSMLTSHLPL